MKKIILYSILIIFFIIVITRLYYLMFYKSDYYKKILDNKNNNIIYGYSAPRGRIIDRNGIIIVDNTGIKTIIYNKLNGINNKDEISIANKLASIIDIEEGNTYSLKHYYYLTHTNEINSLLNDNIKELYKQRKINSDEYYQEKIKLITDDMLSNMTELEKKSANIYSIMSKGYNYQDKIIKKNCTDIEYSKIIEENIPGVRGELTFERINKTNEMQKKIFFQGCLTAALFV